jgi:phage terminase large subunit GpA-like protein
VASDLRRCFAVAKPPPSVRLSEWAADHARLKDGSKFRPWPFQVEILDTMSDPRTSMFTWMKSARVGYTQCMLAYLGHRIANDPGNGLMVRPDDKVVAEFFKEHVVGVLGWPEVKKALATGALTGTIRDTIVAKYFPGGLLKGVGANSPTSFRDHDADFVLFDEVDGYPIVAGADGDQLSLGHKRLEQSHDPRDLAGSTPTEEAISKIYRRFQQSDMRRYNVPCKKCGELQTLVWGHGRDGEPGLRWAPFKAPEEIWYQCKNGCRIEETHKLWCLENGLWIPEKPEVYERTGHAGFHVNSLYSLQPNAEWRDLIKEFLAAYKTPATYKTFVNVTEGEVWRVKGEAPAFERLYQRSRLEQRKAGWVPLGGWLLTAGVDVQQNRLECSVWAWGRGGTSWLVEHKVLMGSPWEKKVWSELTQFVTARFPHENGMTMGVSLVGVDHGYATLAAYRWVKSVGEQFAIPVRGWRDPSAPAIAPSKAMEVSRGRAGRTTKVNVFNVGGHALKQEFYALLALEPEKPEDPRPYGYVDLGSHVSEEFCKQLVAEEWVPDASEWRQKWANEALDCRNYARAVAVYRGIDKWTEADWAVAEATWGTQAADIDEPDPEPERPVIVQKRQPEPEPERRSPEPPPVQQAKPQRVVERGTWLRRR